MTIYRSVAGVNRKIKEQYRGVEGISREIKEQYRGVNGVNRRVFNLGMFPVLYDNGKEETQMSGGWGIVSGLNSSGWVKRTTYLECISYPWTNIAANRKMNFDNFTKAYVELNFATGADRAAFALYITDHEQSGAYAQDGNLVTDYLRYQTTYKRATLSFDISYIKGTHWFGIRHANDYGNTRVFKIWLE